MKFQFILQWPALSIKDYDSLIEIEDLLIQKLAKRTQVDGHDAGSGEMNIFLFTNDPEATFKEVKGILGKHPSWPSVRIAYRNVSQGEKRDFEVVSKEVQCPSAS